MFTTASHMKYPQRILCVVAHADDEALGVGGTLIKRALNGDEVHIVIASESESAKSSSSPYDPERLKKAEDWCRITGCNLKSLYGFPDQKLDQVPAIEIIHRIEKDLEEIRPDVVFTHHPGDMNSDHRVLSHAVLAALRPMTARGNVKAVLAFETPSSTDQAPNIQPYSFQPNYFVSIGEVWDRKAESLSVYVNEIMEFPHPRSMKMIEALAMKRGAECGTGMAEAFCLLRAIEL
jgi:LmbE family N-acetylglucosaminyl deacetylase